VSTDPGPAPDPSSGVFETLLARNGRVQALDRHLGRLSDSLAALYGAGLPEDVRSRVLSLARTLTGSHRIRVTAVGSEVAVEAGPADAAPGQNPVVLVPVLVPGGLGPHKWNDRRLLEALSRGGSVPLLTDEGEELLEAAWANVWILEGRDIITPPADGRILPGVAREMLLGLAAGRGLSAAAEPVSLARARRADAIFLTSSVRHAVGAVLAGNGSGGPARSREHPAVASIRAALDGVHWTPASC